MRHLFYIILIFITTKGYGQSDHNWQYPWDEHFYSQHYCDTAYFGDDVSINRIKRGDTVYEFYGNGNLQSIARIKKIGVFEEIDTNKVTHTYYEFEHDGLCEIYFNSAVRHIAAVGFYEHNKPIGEWRFYDEKGYYCGKSYPMTLWRRTDLYDTSGHLIKQTDVITCVNDDVTVRDVEYINHREKVLLNKTLFAKLYLRFVIPFGIICLGTFFSRVFINSVIYNKEYGTHFSPIVFYMPGYVSKNFEHSLMCTFTFWFWDYKPENKTLVIISNTLSVIALTLFFGAIIGLAVSGELS